MSLAVLPTICAHAAGGPAADMLANMLTDMLPGMLALVDSSAAHPISITTPAPCLTLHIHIRPCMWTHAL